MSIRIVLGLSLSLLASFPTAQAGVFNLPYFLDEGKNSIGAEVEGRFNDGLGLGANFVYTRGISEFSNVQAIVGFGQLPRRFRVGGAMSADFFPDVDNQPGIGIAAKALFVNVGSYGSMEISALPYIHKKFNASGNVIDPFIAVPLGVALSQGLYQTFISLNFGARFQATETFSYIVEAAAPLRNQVFTLSGGVTWMF